MAVDWIGVIADDQRLFHEGPIGVLEALNSWGSGASMPETTPQPSGWTAYVPWAHLTRDATGAYAPLSAADQGRPWTDSRARTGNRAPNTRAHLRHHQMLWLLSNGQWVADWYSDTIGRRMYPFSWIEGTDSDAPSSVFRDEAAGGSSFRALGLANDPRNPANPNEFRDRLWHPFGARRPIPANWVGALSVVFGRLAVDDANQSDDRALCNILMGCSWDWYLAMTLTSPPEQNVNVLYGGFSRLKYLRSDWQIFANTNLSEAQLRANPPPIVGLGLLDEVTTPPTDPPPSVAPTTGRWIDVYRPASPVGRWVDLLGVEPNVAPAWPAPPTTAVQVVTGNVLVYKPQLTAGTPPITYSKASGLSWATVNATTGEVGGTAGTAGTASVVVRALNTWGQADFSLPVEVVASGSAVAPTITTTTLPTLTAGVGGSLPIAITGSGPFVLTTSSGTPPTGTTYVAQAIVIPITVTAGTYTWTVLATGPTALTDTQAYTLTVVDAAVPIVTTTALADGIVGIPYAQAVSATNLPTSWALSGTLPPGVTFNALTAVIAGTPTQAGTFAFVVSASNASGTGSRTLQIVIAEAEIEPPPPPGDRWVRIPRDSEVWVRVPRDNA